MLLVIWNLAGKPLQVSLHRKRCLNYLELFFLLNLGIFTAGSHYFTEGKIRHQQSLAVAMVGSVLVVFCGVLAYQILCTVSRFKAVLKVIQLVSGKVKRKDSVGRDETALQGPTQQQNMSTTTTHSLVEMTECVPPNNELREPLLTN